MKKELTSLVEEALKEINNVSIDANQVRKILTTLATKASQNGLHPLPDVDTLTDDIYHGPIGSKDIAEYLHSKYGTPPAEWWMGLEKGDKFMYKNGAFEPSITRTYSGKYMGYGDKLYLYTLEEGNDVGISISSCSPYTEPSTLEHFMATLTPEQLELAKRLKIEEGGE